MKNTNSNVLIGIGNVGRRDDGLGWKFLDLIKVNLSEDWDCVYRYQLNIEDADLVKKYEKVVFIDAFSEKLPKGFSIEECYPAAGIEYTTHSLNPCAVLALCNNLYTQRPKAHVLKIQGYDWSLKEGLSEQAAMNLDKAVRYFERKFLSIKADT